MEKPLCCVCDQSNGTLTCSDCIPANQIFCHECFEKEHSGKSTRNHTTRDIKNNAMIRDREEPNFPSVELINLHSLDINDFDAKSEFFNAVVPNYDNPSPIDEDKKERFPISPFKNFSINNSFPYSIDPEDDCILFESGIIKKFESLTDLSRALNIDDPTDSRRINIVSFIGKAPEGHSLPNDLLLKHAAIKFVEGVNKTKSPLCSMLYDATNGLLILEHQNMHKCYVHHVDQQNILIRLLLALSDVIVFSEASRRNDYIRIHNIMKICQVRFQRLFSKINRANPALLAPGIIYLTSSNKPIKNDLPTSIKDAAGKEENLFASTTQTISYSKDANSTCEEFKSVLNGIIKRNSQYRARHSLEDILLCINNCRESLSFPEIELTSDDIPNCWFLCPILCEICQARCTGSFEHLGDHHCNNDCQLTPDNQVYFCKACLDNSNGKDGVLLLLKPTSKEEGFLKNLLSYPIRRGIVECDIHGIIYDMNWIISYYQDSVVIKNLHKWPGQSLLSQNVYPMGQIFIDKVKEISEPTTKIVIQTTEYISDIVKPEDWQLTRGTSSCSCCNTEFTINMFKHHCRHCKMVVCSNCFIPRKSMPICLRCNEGNSLGDVTDDTPGITLLKFFRDSYNMSSQFVKKNILSFNRPDYWEEDEKAIKCFICTREFHNEFNPIHHCRACGKCVCEKCSTRRRKVEWRCISEPSRICDECIETHHWKGKN